LVADELPARGGALVVFCGAAVLADGAGVVAGRAPTAAPTGACVLKLSSAMSPATVPVIASNTRFMIFLEGFQNVNDSWWM
jgi:hypothetical protein